MCWIPTDQPTRSSAVGFLAHLYGAYARPMALLTVGHRLCGVACGAHSTADMKVIYHTNVSRMPGLCLLNTDGATYISHKIMAGAPYFHIFDFFM